MNDEVGVFNPLSEDFTVYHDNTGKNPLKFTLKSLENTYIPKPYANHVKTALCDRILHIRGYQNYELSKKEIMDEIDGDKT